VDNEADTRRPSPEQMQVLEPAAEADGVPVAEVAPTAIEAQVQQRRRDQAFQDRLRASVERNQPILEKLADQ
jgi:hypothetical protein